MTKSKVLFTREITPEKLIGMYQALDKPLRGKIGVDRIETIVRYGYRFREDA